MDTTSTVVVTGGGTGIGRAVAEAFLPTSRVIALGMDQDADLTAGIEFRKTDVTPVDEVRDSFRELDHIASLVNCAGVILHEGREFDPSGFRKVVDINLCGSQTVIAEARALLAAAGGSVVNMASMWSYFGSQNNPAYTASKAGVLGLTRSYAAALAEQGVRVNAVAPGWIRTRLSAGALENAERSAAIMARLPMKRWGEPEDIARAVKFLCSPDASYITGVILPVDGGYGIA